MTLRNRTPNRTSAVCVAFVSGKGIRLRDAVGLATAARAEAVEIVCVVRPDDPNLPAYPRVLGEALPLVGEVNVDAIADELAAHSVRGVFTFDDGSLPMVAALGARLDLPTLSGAAAGIVSSKFRQRDLLNRAGASAQRSVRLTAATAASVAAAPPVSFPAVVKPEHGTGASFTQRVDDARELEPVVRAAPAQTMVLEELIPRGHHPVDWLTDMSSVDSVVANGEICHFGVCDRLPFAEPFRESGAIFPSVLPRDEQDQLLDATSRAITALGVDHAVVHTELRCGTEEPAVIEVNARLGGYVNAGWGRVGAGSPQLAALRLALGRQVDPPAAPSGFAGVRIVHAPLGALELIQAPTVPALKAIEGVWQVDPVRRPGDEIDTADGMLSRLADVWIEGATSAEFAQRLRRVDAEIEAGVEVVLAA